MKALNKIAILRFFAANINLQSWFHYFYANINLITIRICLATAQIQMLNTLPSL